MVAKVDTWGDGMIIKCPVEVLKTSETSPGRFEIDYRITLPHNGGDVDDYIITDTLLTSGQYPIKIGVCVNGLRQYALGVVDVDFGNGWSLS